MNEMFYLMMHSTHFYLWLYGVGHMEKDYSDSERGNPLPPLHGLLFLISMHNPTDRIAHTTAFAISFGTLVETRKGQWDHHEGSI